MTPCVYGTRKTLASLVSRLVVKETGTGCELCECRGGRPELPVPNSPYGLFGRKATFEENEGVGCVVVSALVNGYLARIVCIHGTYMKQAGLVSCLVVRMETHSGID